MNPLVKVVIFLVGAGMIYKGYTDKNSPDVPDNPAPVVPDDRNVTIKIISDTNEPIPAPPNNASVLAASTPIRTILAADPNDAIKVARTAMGFAELIGRNSTIKTTAEFNSSLMEAFEIVFQRHGIAAKQYPLNAPIQATLVAAFSSIPGGVENGALGSVPWNSATQTAAIEALRAISYQAYQAWADGHKRVTSSIWDTPDWNNSNYGLAPEPLSVEGPEYVSYSGTY